MEEKNNKNNDAHKEKPVVSSGMDEKAYALIKSQLEAQKRSDEIRRELISQGHSTLGFDEAYKSLRDELGIKDPEPEPAKKEWATILPVDTVAVPDGHELPNIFYMVRYGVALACHHYSAIISAICLSLVGIALFVLIPETPTPYLYGVPYVVASILLATAGFFISILSSVALTYTIVRTDRQVSYVDGLLWSVTHFWSVAWVSLVGAAIFMAGLVALVIPGVAFAIYNLFSLFAVMEEDQRGMQAITRSVDLVIGHFWGILARVFIVILVGLPFLILAVIASIFIEPITMTTPALSVIGSIPALCIQTVYAAVSVAMLTNVYKARTAHKKLYDASEYRGLRLTFWLMTFLGVLIPIGLVIAGIFSFNAYFADYQMNYVSNFTELALPQAENTENFDDYVLHTKIDQMFQAGTIYYGRIRTFEGVCSDVLIEKPAICKSTEDTFTIYAPVTTGKYYCRDSNGFKGMIEGAAPTAQGCR